MVTVKEDLVSIIELLNRALDNLTNVNANIPLSQLLNEYMEKVKKLERDAQTSLADILVPYEVLKAFDDNKHPDKLLHEKLKSWRAANKQHDLKLSTLQSLGSQL